MVTSVNTNAPALKALQDLKATNREMEEVQNRINTGRKVNRAKDNGAVFAIAQNLRADVGGLKSVQHSLDRAMSTVSTALSAGESISDLLISMKEKAASAADAGLDAASRNALNEDFKALRDQISTIVENASFNGINMIKNGGTDVSALANDNGTSTLTVAAEDLSLAGSTLAIDASTTLGASAASAQSVLSDIETSINNVNAALARLGTGSKSLETHKTFMSKMSDTLEAGIGNLVDADMAKESARLQSLQVKQELGTQALSIANRSPQHILSLFQG